MIIVIGSIHCHIRTDEMGVAVGIKKKPEFVNCTVRYPGDPGVIRVWEIQKSQWIAAKNGDKPSQSQLCLRYKGATGYTETLTWETLDSLMAVKE